MLLERLEIDELVDWLELLWLDVDCELLLSVVVDCELVDKVLCELVLRAAVLELLDELLLADELDSDCVDVLLEVFVPLLVVFVWVLVLLELALNVRLLELDVLCELVVTDETELNDWLDCELIDRLTVMLEQLDELTPPEVVLCELVLNPAVLVDEELELDEELPVELELLTLVEDVLSATVLDVLMAAVELVLMAAVLVEEVLAIAVQLLEGDELELELDDDLDDELDGELVLISAVLQLLDELLRDDEELLLSSSIDSITGAWPFGWQTTPDNNPSK